MNYLHQKSISFFSQISIVSLIFLLAFQIPVFAGTGENTPTSSNKYNYQNSQSRSLSVVGVAITTNLGTKHTQIKSLPANIYKDVLTIEQLVNSSQGARDDIISKNMLLIQEYLNISKTNIKGLLNNSYDKSGTLKSYLDTLKSRYALANRQIVSLNAQKKSFEATMAQTNTQIQNLKLQISKDFSAVNTDATLEHIEKYLELKNTYTTARMYIIYINKFITQYEYLNSYNSDIANTLIQNSDAIIKDAYIVLPQSGNTQLLEDLNLILESNEIK